MLSLKKRETILKNSQHEGILAFTRIKSVWLLAHCVSFYIRDFHNHFKRNYVNPIDQSVLSTTEAVYAVFTLLTFETIYPFPKEWYTEALYFILPLFGVILLGQILVRLGRALFDEEAWQIAMAKTYKDHVIVCGLGKVGFRTTKKLLAFGETVVGIGLAGNDPFIDWLRALKIPVIHADARQTDILIEAGIKKASAIIPCTNDDIANLDIALQAKHLNPNIKVVLRLFDDEVAKRLEKGFDIHYAFSTSALAAPAFAAAATSAPVDYAFNFDGLDRSQKVLLTLSKFTVIPTSPLSGYTLNRLESEFRLAVLIHFRNNELNRHPQGDIVLKPNDQFVVSASLETLEKIAELTPATKHL